jgi:protein SCO1/2
MTTRWTLALMGCLAAVSACRKNQEGSATPTPTATAAAHPTTPPHELLPVTDVVQGASIYPLKVTILDQLGKKSGLDVYRGKVVMIALFYASCPHACPTLISHLRAIDAALAPDVRKDTRVLLVSFDPANDTPDALNRLAEVHKVDLSRWKFATAVDDQVREIAAVLGIKYRQTDGSFNHSSVITLLDRDGRIDLRSDGLADATDPVAQRVRELVARGVGPSRGPSR